MDFSFTDEQTMLRDAAREWLADLFPIDHVIEVVDGEPGWQPASWPGIASLGWLGLSVPEALGGSGMSFLEEAVLFEMTGAALWPGPLLSTVGTALPALSGELLVGVLAGARSATVAVAEQGGPVGLSAYSAVSCAARPGGADGWVLSGVKRFVPDLAIVTDAVVVARGPAGVGLYGVDLTAAPAGTVVPQSTADRTRRLGDLVLDATPAVELVAPEQAAAVVEAMRRRLLAALACEAVGVAQRALDLAASYAKERTQFGRPIGAYQAVSHPIADVYRDVTLARSLAYWAAWCVAADDPSVDAACAAAQCAAGPAAVAACEKGMQALGGIGFTWDHPLHRYYKRAQAIEAAEGGAPAARRGIAAALLDA